MTTNLSVMPRGKVSVYGEESCPFCASVREMLTKYPYAKPIVDLDSFHLVGVYA